MTKFTVHGDRTDKGVQFTSSVIEAEDSEEAKEVFLERIDDSDHDASPEDFEVKKVRRVKRV